MPRTTTSLETRAAQLRNAGSTWDEITASLGFTNTTAARRAVRIAEGRPAPRRNRIIADLAHATRYGVEIEFRRPRNARVTVQQIIDALAAEGVVAVDPGYCHTVMTTWKIVPDGSSDLELVSPPLQGAEGIRQLSAATRVLRSLGCRVSQSEGLHVHIEVRPLRVSTRQRLFDIYTGRQHAIDSLVPRSRRNAYYCQWLNETDRVTGRNVLAEARSIDYHGGRYRTVNVCSFPRYGTLEFRQHHGTIDGRKIAEWVRFLLAQVALAETDIDLSTVPTDLDGFTRYLVDQNMLSDDDRTRLLARRARYTR